MADVGIDLLEQERWIQRHWNYPCPDGPEEGTQKLIAVGQYQHQPIGLLTPAGAQGPRRAADLLTEFLVGRSRRLGPNEGHSTIGTPQITDNTMQRLMTAPHVSPLTRLIYAASTTVQPH
jgi:hypothetical protein